MLPSVVEGTVSRDSAVPLTTLGSTATLRDAVLLQHDTRKHSYLIETSVPSTTLVKQQLPLETLYLQLHYRKHSYL